MPRAVYAPYLNEHYEYGPVGPCHMPVYAGMKSSKYDFPGILDP